MPEVQSTSYLMRLEHLKMNSVQRRIERYKIIYVWKTIEGRVPENSVHLVPGKNRNGRLWKIPCLKPLERAKREQSFQVAGPRLFSCLSKKVRTVTNCTLDEFKEQLDEFLTSVPDEPKIWRLMPHNFQQSNSILFQVARRSEKLNCRKPQFGVLEALLQHKSITKWSLTATLELNCYRTVSILTITEH